MWIQKILYTVRMIGKTGVYEYFFRLQNLLVCLCNIKRRCVLLILKVLNLVLHFGTGCDFKKQYYKSVLGDFPFKLWNFYLIKFIEVWACIGLGRLDAKIFYLCTCNSREIDLNLRNIVSYFSKCYKTLDFTNVYLSNRLSSSTDIFLLFPRSNSDLFRFELNFNSLTSPR